MVFHVYQTLFRPFCLNNIFFEAFHSASPRCIHLSPSGKGPIQCGNWKIHTKASQSLGAQQVSHLRKLGCPCSTHWMGLKATIATSTCEPPPLQSLTRRFTRAGQTPSTGRPHQVTILTVQGRLRVDTLERGGCGSGKPGDWEGNVAPTCNGEITTASCGGRKRCATQVFSL